MFIATDVVGEPSHLMQIMLCVTVRCGLWYVVCVNDQWGSLNLLDRG